MWPNSGWSRIVGHLPIWVNVALGTFIPTCIKYGTGTSTGPQVTYRRGASFYFIPLYLGYSFSSHTYWLCLAHAFYIARRTWVPAMVKLQAATVSNKVVRKRKRKAIAEDEGGRSEMRYLVRRGRLPRLCPRRRTMEGRSHGVHQRRLEQLRGHLCCVETPRPSLRLPSLGRNR